MRINHGHADIRVPEQLLQRCKIISCIQKICRKGVPARVPDNFFGNLRMRPNQLDILSHPRLGKQIEY